MNRRGLLKLALISPIAVMFKPKSTNPLDYLADGTAYIDIEGGQQRLAYVHHGVGYKVSEELLDPIYPGKKFFWPSASNIRLPGDKI